MYRCEEGRQPVDIDLAVSVQVDEDCTGGLLRPPVLTADEASPLGVAHQPHLPTPLRRPHPLLQLHSCQNSMKLIYYSKCKIHMAIKKVKINFKFLSFGGSKGSCTEKNLNTVCSAFITQY